VRVPTRLLFPAIIYVTLNPDRYRSPASPSSSVQSADTRSCALVNSALEPFGFGGILFGSAPSAASSATMPAGEWYALLHALFTDPHSPGLRVGQDAVDEFFFKNALSVYGPPGKKEDTGA
jgi:hypothetical protein